MASGDRRGTNTAHLGAPLVQGHSDGSHQHQQAGHRGECQGPATHSPPRLLELHHAPGAVPAVVTLRPVFLHL